MATSWFDSMLFGKSARFYDHRGRATKLLGAAPVGFDGDPANTGAVREARAAVRRHMSARDWGCLWAVAAYVGMCLVLTFRNSGNGFELSKSLGILAVALGVPAAITWSSARVRGSRRIAAALLAEGLCPQCGYGIGGVPAEGDGCSVCPECSAAWRVPEVRRGAGAAAGRE